MGALSVWLGFRLTLLVLIVSTIIVVLVSAGAIAWSIATGTLQARRRKHLATGKDDSERRYGAETVEQKQQRRIMAYALPVALATWAVMAWKLPTLP
jgi:prepilin peptidase CpaA